MNKICTSIEQSLKLIELGIDVNTADMYYYDKNIFSGAMSAFNGVLLIRDGKFPDNTTPAWSLAALLNVLPSATVDTSNDHYFRVSCHKRTTEWYDNAVDACIEMIIKLHELKML